MLLRVAAQSHTEKDGDTCHDQDGENKEIPTNCYKLVLYFHYHTIPDLIHMIIQVRIFESHLINNSLNFYIYIYVVICKLCPPHSFELITINNFQWKAKDVQFRSIALSFNELTFSISTIIKSVICKGSISNCSSLNIRRDSDIVLYTSLSQNPTSPRFPHRNT